jgi:(1->4)-alpha-D-glucan 1-alpha-D-glucosylmutase
MSDVALWAQRIAESVAETVRNHLCHPTATYRLQFVPGTMTFRDAAAIAAYLQELGISHLYASPYLKARTGGGNGYAIVDYTQLNPELGSEKEFGAMVAALHKHGLGQILDTVPNHMSATPTENLWWSDVLENGPASPYAAYFDVDWRPVKEELRDKVLLPILGGQYGQVLESGLLQLEYQQGTFALRYYEWRLPLDPRSYRIVLTHNLSAIKATRTEQVAADSSAELNTTSRPPPSSASNLPSILLPPESEELREFESILTALEHLPECTVTEPAAIAERQREKEVIKRRLRELTDRSAAVAEFIGRNVREFNGTPDDPHSYDDLDKLLDAQAYRLSHWKAAADEINYRRFFDINELAAVCMELPDVFARSHALVFDLLLRGDVNGLRVDHIDGLYDPLEYLRRLQKGYLSALGKAVYVQLCSAGGSRSPLGRQLSGLAEAEAASETATSCDPPAWDEVEPLFLAKATEMTCCTRTALPLYVVVEKILGEEETLHDEWLLAGTTGYNFLDVAEKLFVDPDGLVELENVYSRFIDKRLDFREVAHQSKHLVLHSAMSSELQLLAHRLNRISERHRRSRDFTLNTLRVSLREILVCFPVYRTYIRDGCVSGTDRQIICRAVAQAKRRNPATDAAVFDFIRDVLLLEAPPDLDEAGRRERELFVGRFQQVTSPVTAKGIEDTAFYRYFPLASLNEVGSDLRVGPTAMEEFHRHNLARQAAWPYSLISTSTHDTKRSEDARRQISVLSEIPHLWRKAVNRWARLNWRHCREVDGQPAPSRNDEYLFYQSLVGVWPPAPPGKTEIRKLQDRLAAYMQKATHEAKLRTSWISPNAEYDAAVREFVVATLDDRPKNRFMAEFRTFHESIVNWGLYAALAQTLLKLTSPGVPDVYQGQELWDFSLVDPDNRRPVDFALRRKMLARLRKDVGRNERSLLALARQLAVDPRDPRLKLFVTWRVLQFRREHADLFGSGNYVPLSVEGVKARNLCAFARRLPSSEAAPAIAVVLAPRLIAQLTAATDSVSPPPPLGATVWQDTRIALDGAVGSQPPLKNLFTGQVWASGSSPMLVADILADFPVALLVNA